MMMPPLRIAFFGSSLLSTYWNGAATYYRGMIRALAAHGHRITFYEPDALDRQAHRDMDEPEWARVVVYPANHESQALAALESARDADIIVKASGVGVHDELLERAALTLRRPGTVVIFWDVDAPATLERVAKNPTDPFESLARQYDLVLTYGGGQPVVEGYRALGAARCVPIYNALDPFTHHPVAPDARFHGLLGFLGNRLPDREARVHEFLFGAARLLPDETFLLGGSGWQQHSGAPPNVKVLGHVPSGDHNAFNVTPRCVLNVNRDSMARFGFSPPTRVFEAAGAGACLISDAWEGLDQFLEPGREVLVARGADEVVQSLLRLSEPSARAIGRAARRRVLGEHTYEHRARQFESVIQGRGVAGVAA
jgi:spore maturation protein CgeB